MDKLCGITTCRNRCCVSSTEFTGHQCDPSVVAATGSACSWHVSLVVSPLPFLLSVRLSVSPSSCWCWGVEQVEGQQISVIPSVLRNQDCKLSPSVISQNVSEAGTMRHSKNYFFNSFLLIMQIFWGKHKDGITTDFYVLSVPVGISAFILGMRNVYLHFVGSMCPEELMCCCHCNLSSPLSPVF